jgi:hypothetical protein
MSTAAAAAAAAGARSPPLPARRSPLPRQAQVPEEPSALPGDASAAVPRAAVSARRERARRRPEPPLPFPPSRAAPPHPGEVEGGGSQLPAKNNLERALGVPLPAHTSTRRGIGLATPHVPAPGPLSRGGRIWLHLGDASRARRTRLRGPRCCGGAGGCADTCRPFPRQRWGLEGQSMALRPKVFSLLIFL